MRAFSVFIGGMGRVERPDYCRISDTCYQASLIRHSENSAQHFVVRSTGRIVASVGAFIKSDLPFRYFVPASYGFIGDVYTEPSVRRMGVATKLNQKALEWLSSRGIKSVRLLASDAARPMYEKLGFCASDEMVLTPPT